MKMLEDIYKQNPDRAWAIIRYLMFRSKILEETSLTKGQMGVVIMFCSYSRFAGKPKFEQLADEQVEYVLHIPDGMPVGLDGLCGIGWGITYLFKHGFVTGNPDELLMPLDALLANNETLTEQEQHDVNTYHSYRQGDNKSEDEILNQIWSYWNHDYTKNHTSDMGQP